MKNYVQDGEVVTLPTPDGGVVSGEPYQIGQILAISSVTITDAEYHAGTKPTFEGKRKGVFNVTKAGTQAWAVGALVYWDDGARNFTTTAAGNHLAGFAVVATGAGVTETAGVVLLDGCAREDEST